MTEQPKGSPDPVGDFQRWLIRSSARNVTRGVGDQIRSMIGVRNTRSDVWQTATADPDPDGTCAWCPVCRAARLLRESGPGLATQMSAAGDALSGLFADAVAAAEAALANAGRAANPGPANPGPANPGTENPPREPDDRG